MGLSCMLGLTACLSFGGHAIPAQDVFAILDNCDLLRQLPVASFVVRPDVDTTDMHRAAMASMGAATGEYLERKGLVLEWPPYAAARKAAWLRTCARFSAAANQRSNWTHLEKMP